MLISCIKVSKVFIIFTILIAILLCFFSCYYIFFNKPNTNSNIVSANVDVNSNSNIEEDTEDKSYIKWFEFKPTYDVLLKTSKLDIDSHNSEKNVQYNWIELISYLACKYGNDFKKFKQADLDKLISRLDSGENMDVITKDMKLYSYYYEGYSAVLSQFIGEYQIQKPSSTTSSENTAPFTKVYGIKAFHPLAQNYSYSHYDDFGNSRSYGYKRVHLGNDLMGSIGTPVISVESGIVEALRLEPIWWLACWYSQF